MALELKEEIRKYNEAISKVRPGMPSGDRCTMITRVITDQFKMDYYDAFNTVRDVILATA